MLGDKPKRSAEAIPTNRCKAAGWDRKVRYQAGKLVDGAATAFVKRVAQRASGQVLRRANQTMRQNAARDGVRYARVPMGGETCTFCAMLVSRGFVYHKSTMVKVGWVLEDGQDRLRMTTIYVNE